MSVDWRRLTRDAGLRLDAEAIEVVFGDQRRQRVFVEAVGGDTVRLWSIVARPSDLAGLRTPLVDAWRRNRLSELVAFTLDRHGRMIGESWVPAEALSPHEWGFYVRNLARACDRFEYLLTGRDSA